jgi:hypothetical protein
LAVAVPVEQSAMLAPRDLTVLSTPLPLLVVALVVMLTTVTYPFQTAVPVVVLPVPLVVLLVVELPVRDTVVELRTMALLGVLLAVAVVVLGLPVLEELQEQVLLVQLPVLPSLEHLVDTVRVQATLSTLLFLVLQILAMVAMVPVLEVSVDHQLAAMAVLVLSYFGTQRISQSLSGPV